MASDDAVTTIIESLKEHDELPRKQIAEIVEVVGFDVALELLAETRRVQDEGGVEVRDGTRRRTDGGVFFSLAKTKLPKADRNRIFRVRPPKSPDAPAAEAAPEPPPAKVPAVEQRRSHGNQPVAMRDARPLPPGLGRRRVVEVDVLRYQPKPIVEKVPEVRAPAPSKEPVARDHAGPVEMRPLRRIVTVAPTVKNEPPATPDAARDRVREIIKAIGLPAQRRVLLDVLREIGGLPEPEVKRAPEPKREPKPVPKEEPDGVSDKTREHVLAAVTDALGLSNADLARALYGEETAGARAKARNVLERWRKS